MHIIEATFVVPFAALALTIFGVSLGKLLANIFPN